MSRGTDHLRKIIAEEIEQNVLQLFQSSPESQGEGSSMEDCCKEVLRKLDEILDKLKQQQQQLQNEPNEDEKNKKLKQLIKDLLEQLFKDWFKDRSPGGDIWDYDGLPDGAPSLPVPDPLFLPGSVAPDVSGLDMFGSFAGGLLGGMIKSGQPSSDASDKCMEIMSILKQIQSASTHTDTAITDLGSQLAQCCSGMHEMMSRLQSEVSSLRGLL